MSQKNNSKSNFQFIVSIGLLIFLIFLVNMFIKQSNQIITIEKSKYNLKKSLDSIKTTITKLNLKLDTIQKSNLLLKKRVDSLDNKAIKFRKDLESLSVVNRQLQTNLYNNTSTSKYNSSLFNTELNAIPGEVLRGKFSASIRSQNVDRVRVNLSLNLLSKLDGNIIFKVFDANNNEIPTKPYYIDDNLGDTHDPTNQNVMLEFVKGKLERKDSGTYFVRLYIVNENKKKQEIGVAQFEVR